MANSFLAPLIGNSTKAAIIEALTENQALTTKELYNLVTKNAQKPITYQAIHKAITEMINDEILEKMDKKVSISKGWAEKLSDFASLIKSKNEEPRNTAPKIKTQTYEFDTFVEMGKFVIKFLYETPNPKNGPSFCILRHAWPVLGYNKEDYLRFTETVNKSPFYEFVEGTTPLDRLFGNTFEKMGKKVFFGKPAATTTDTIIKADRVLQIIFTTEFAKQYDQIFKQYNNSNAFQVNDVLLNFIVKKTRITVNIIFDKNLAGKIINDSLSKINAKRFD